MANIPATICVVVLFALAGPSMLAWAPRLLQLLLSSASCTRAVPPVCMRSSLPRGGGRGGRQGETTASRDMINATASMIMTTIHLIAIPARVIAITVTAGVQRATDIDGDVVVAVGSSCPPARGWNSE